MTDKQAKEIIERLHAYHKSECAENQPHERIYGKILAIEKAIDIIRDVMYETGSFDMKEWENGELFKYILFPWHKML